MPKPPSKKKVDDAIDALNSVRRRWLRRSGVTAVDVGFKIKGDKMTDDVALRVHVRRKLPAAELAGGDVFNESGKSPKTVKGFPVDVIEAQYGPSTAKTAEPVVLEDADEQAIAAIERTTTFDPLIGGISCGNPRVTAGTLGAIVFNRANCRPMILSNWHVLAGASAAAAGEDILQPGRVDGGTQAVATLTQMRLDSRMDAAVATLNGVRNHTRDILGLNPIAGTEAATLGMQVVKSGRTTGVTRGVVDGVSLSVSINYGDPGVVAFSDQIRIVPRPPWPAVDVEISSGGDSGSVWLNESNNRAIGLHFAGETDPLPASENAICSPIGPIMTEFNISFLPVLCPIQPPVFDLCDRFPGLCALLRDPIFRFPRPRPLPDPTPFRRRLNDSRFLANLLEEAGGPATGDDGCHCQTHADLDQEEVAQLVLLLAAHLNRGR
jgi:endonuclease G